MQDPPSVEEGLKQEELAEQEAVTPVPTKQPVELNTKKVTIDGVEYNEVEVIAALAAKKTGTTKLILPETRPSKPGKMLIGRCVVRLDAFGSTTPRENVTPAEVLLLAALHHENANGYPILNLEITGEIDRTSNQELRRLRGRYGDKAKALFPGAIPQMPPTFAEAILLGNEVEVPQATMVAGAQVPDAMLQFNAKALNSD